jgi:DNA-directed RNA polymerase subunit K/omega
MIDSSKKGIVESKFSKYEIARILGARALQISMNAPVLLKIKKEELESISYDPLRIAEMEFYEGVLPITVKRPLPSRSADRIAKMKEESIPKKQKVIEKPKEKEAVKEKAQPKEEPSIEGAEKEEEEIIKEVAGTELMELATPEDEAEQESTFEADAGGEE